MSQFNLGTVSISAAFNDTEARAAAQRFYKDVQQMSQQATPGAAVNAAGGPVNTPGAIGTIHPAVAEQEARRAALTYARQQASAAERQIRNMTAANMPASSIAPFMHYRDEQRAAALRIMSQGYEEREAGRGLRAWDREAMGREARVDRSFDATGLAAQRVDERGRRRAADQFVRAEERLQREQIGAMEEHVGLIKDRAKFERSQMPAAQRVQSLQYLLQSVAPGSRAQLELEKELAAAGGGGGGGFWNIFGRGGGGGLGAAGRFFGRLLSSPRGLAATAGVGAIAAATGSMLHQYFQGEDIQRTYKYGGEGAGLQAELAGVQSRPGGVFGRALRRWAPFGTSDEQATEAIMAAQQSLRGLETGRGIYLSRLGTAQTITELQQRASLAGQTNDLSRSMLHSEYGVQRITAEREIGLAGLKTQLINTYDPTGSNTFEIRNLRKQIREYEAQTPRIAKAARLLGDAEERHALFVSRVQNREVAASATATLLRLSGNPQEAMDWHFQTQRQSAREITGPLERAARFAAINAEEQAARFAFGQDIAGVISNLAVSEDFANQKPRTGGLRSIRDKARIEAAQVRTTLGNEAGRMRLQQGRNELRATMNEYMNSLDIQEIRPEYTAFGVPGATRENIPGVLQAGENFISSLVDDKMMKNFMGVLTGSIIEAFRAARNLVD
jgi:hypothetical protein